MRLGPDESDLEAKELEKLAFFDLAERLARTSDRAEKKRFKEELARMTFGDRRSDGPISP